MPRFKYNSVPAGKALYYAIILFGAVISFSSCSIQKRYYRSGFNIDWRTRRVGERVNEAKVESPPKTLADSENVPRYQSTLIAKVKGDESPKPAKLIAARKAVVGHTVTKTSQVIKDGPVVPERKFVLQKTDNSQNVNHDPDQNWLLAGGACGDIAIIMFIVYALSMVLALLLLGLMFFIIGGIFIGVGGHFEGHDSRLAAGLAYILYTIYVPFYLLYLGIRGIIRLCKKGKPTQV